MTSRLLLLMFPAAALAGTVANRDVDPLIANIQNVLVRTQIPGAGLAIVTTDRVIWAGGLGNATGDTLFRLGSNSKSFVALALLKLASEGKVDLEATLESVAPEIDVPNPWRATDPVRIAHVLEHTAGFDDSRFAEDYYPPGVAPESPLQVLRRFPGPQRVRWRPGTRFAYSNPGYVVAGYLIEKVTGRPYDEYIRDAILLPLGMKRSGFRLTGGAAAGHNYRPPRALPYRASVVGPAGDFMSSPAEFAPFLQALLRRELAGQDRMEHGRTSAAARAGIGEMYGFANLPWPGSYHAHGHGGLIEGFRSIYAYHPDAGIAYVLMTNTSAPGGGWYEIRRLISEFVSKGMEKRVAPMAFPGAVGLDRFAGVYVPKDYRWQIAAFSEAYVRSRRVIWANGSLYASGLLGEGRQRLVPVTAATFRVENETEASIAFVPTVEGPLALAGPRGYFERVPSWQPYVYAGAVVAAMVLMASSILYGFVWVWRRRTLDRAIPLAAVLCLAGAGLLVAAFVEDMSVLGHVNFRTVGYVVFSWLFVGFSLAGLAVALRRRRVYALAVSVSCCVVAVALADWGLLGIRLWRY